MAIASRGPDVAIVAWAAAMIFLLTSCVPSAPTDSEQTEPPQAPISLDERDRELWARTVEPLLADDLWSSRDAYDASHVLMAPLDAAFRAPDRALRLQFADQFTRFATATESPLEIADSPLAFRQYLYLAARFVALASRNGDSILIPDELPQYILVQLESTWLREDAWLWDREPFQGEQERIAWKLETADPDESYYVALFDEELMTFGIAAEYRRYERAAAIEKPSTVISEILASARNVLEKWSTFPGNGWLFQAGVWSDHPDYAYSAVAEPGEKALTRDDVAVDSSHSGRWPVLLNSLRGAEPVGADGWEYYDDLERRLARQFIEKALVSASIEHPFPRMTNYIDGGNELFRWDTGSAAQAGGYGPFELSGSLLVVWWGLLPDSDVNATYCDLAGRFPLTAEAIELYTGPNTPRERHPLLTWPAFFVNGFAELEARLMCEIGS